MSNNNQLAEQYRLRFESSQTYRNGVWQILCNNFFQDFIPTQATVLDLGAGWGEFIGNIRCAQKFAMDLNPDTAKHIQADVHFLNQDCSQHWQLNSESLDVVFTSNFLEHLTNKQSVEATVVEAHRCLKTGGLMVCIGPNIKYLPGAYWDFWDHHVPMTENSLAELLKMAGFDIEHCVPRFLPYTMSDGWQPPLGFIKLYLKLKFVWPIFGKQFLIIARKHGAKSEQ